MYFEAENYAQIPYNLKKEASYILIEVDGARWDGDYPFKKATPSKQVSALVEKDLGAVGGELFDETLRPELVPGTVEFVADIDNWITDDGEGGFVDQDGEVVLEGTVDYETGAVNVTLPGVTDDTVSVEFLYERFNAIGDVKKFADSIDETVVFLPLEGLGESYNVH